MAWVGGPIQAKTMDQFRMFEIADLLFVVTGVRGGIGMFEIGVGSLQGFVCVPKGFPVPDVLGYVAGNFRCSNDAAVRILNRRNRQREIQQRPVLALAFGFEVIYALSAAKLGKNFRLFPLTVIRIRSFATA